MTSTTFKYILFADDTYVFFSHRSLDQLFDINNKKLTVTGDWFMANRLSLNLKKQLHLIPLYKEKKLSSNRTLHISGVRITQV